MKAFKAVYTSALFIFFVIFHTSCTAQEQTFTVVDDGQSLLWKIEADHLEKPSFLFGTIHLIPKQDFKMGSVTESVLRSSDLIVMEVHLDNEALLEMTMMMMMPEGKELSEIMSQDQYGKFQRFLRDSLNLSPVEVIAYENIKPILLSQLLYSNVMGESPMSFELEFQRLAEEENIPIKGLETIADQMSFFDRIPLEEQVNIMIESIENINEMEDYLRRLIDYYKNEELDQIYKLVTEDESMQAYMDILLDERNKNWIAPLENFMRDGQTFVAVGAGHLPGEMGVINLLKEAGYTLTPIQSSN